MNIEKYTQNAQGAIIDCQNIAVEEGNQQIDGEHLHLALLMQKEGLEKCSLYIWMKMERWLFTDEIR